MYLGSWKIDDYVTFSCNVHNTSTGAAADADSAPSYRVYEDETSTPIVTGSLAILDAGNTTGFYTERLQLTAASGFEKGKSYTIYIQATLNSITGTMSHSLQIEAEVDSNIVSDKTGYSLSSEQTYTLIGNVSGSVGSVVGNVGGNIVGSVGSVTGAVGSVAGNVSGSVASVVGSVGSVTGAVGSVAGNVSGSVDSVVGAVGSVAGNVSGSVASVIGGVTVTTNNDKTDYVLSSAAIQSVQSGLATSSEITTLRGVDDDTLKTISDQLDGISVSGSTPEAIWSYDTRTITGGIVDSVAGNVSGSVNNIISSVTVGTNNDKTGYSLSSTQTYTLIGNISGNVTGSVGSVSSVQDKTGYSLSEAGITSVQSGLATSSEITSLNNISSSDVLTQCTSALNSYDPPTKTELDSAVSGLATSAMITSLRGTDDDTLKTLSDQIDGISSGSGATAQEVWEYTTRTITGGTIDSVAGNVSGSVGSVVNGATLTQLNSLISGIRGTDNRELTEIYDSLSEISISGSSPTAIASAVWSNDSRTITGTVTTDYTGPVIAVPEPSAADICRVYMYVKDADGTIPSSVTATAEVINLPHTDGSTIYTSTELDGEYTTSTGLFYFDLPQSATVKITSSDLFGLDKQSATKTKSIAVPATSLSELEDLL